MTTPPCADEYIGWHFADNTLRDGTPFPKAGDTLRMDGPVTLCARGFHASERAIDALNYAPGLRIARVVLRGDVIRDANKAVATERHYLTGYVDAWPILETWLRESVVLPAREHAVAALRSARLPEQADTLAAVPSDASLRDIEDAARATEEAAWAAARATGEAAWAAAGEAAREAAGAAARAARDAARAAGDAASEAEGERQNATLTDVLLTLFEPLEATP